MAFTKPTGDQISFRSASTGTHTLDNYLEACEKGGFTLSALMDNLFTDQGALNPSALQFRVSETDATNPVLQARFGIFTDPSVGWFDTNQKFFNQRGEFTAGTAYSRLDMVRSGSAVNICLASHTSASVIDSTKFILFFDGAAILSEIQDFKTNSEPRLDFLEESVLLDIDVL